ncbi:mitochondrial DNA polymerase I protein B, putative [Leishmania donovani]|uniref:DNA polymerase A family protein n=1 Tax=Leishmania donovani TaxID=5661 RepID=E9BB83_LEIDO|nr:mitochondrial DNA polymerase I protein B, putative [Leishmania donovani]TPP45107.1 DNA polymerase A family protein [Leishmania donovani]CBZ32508.1 mitochondrial DNA polymerase I protein B, putative [Leishmania donovani]
MFRRLSSSWPRALVQPLRSSCTVQSLTKAQAALARGKAPSMDAAAEYAEFFRVPISVDAGVVRSTQEYYTNIRRLAAENQSAVAQRNSPKKSFGESSVATFLAGYHFQTATFQIFSIAADTIVCSVDTRMEASEVWSVADELMTHISGESPQLALIPVVETEQERKRLQEPLQKLTALLKFSGLQVATHVDTLELSSVLCHSPPSPHDITQDALSGVSPAPMTCTWFQAHWAFIRTAACQAMSADPLQTVSTYVLPRFSVYLIHLVRAGTRGLNVSLWDPVSRRRFSAKGMLSDVLACLLDTRSSQMILVPTNRTDRAALFRCRTAVVKAGHDCVVVYASEVSDRLRGCYQSDLMRYWGAMKEAANFLDADLLFGIYTAAGNTLRSYQRKKLSQSQMCDHLRLLNSSSDEGIATPQNVLDWACYFTLPKRVAAEKAELRHYDKFITIAYVATDHTVHAQPMNPVADINHVLSACITDHANRTVEPWAIYTKRGQFCLPSLDGYDVLVTHDAKSLVLLLSGDAELQKFIKRGGRVWCVTLAEYLLEAQRCTTGSNGLYDLALRHGVQLPPSSRVGTPNDRLPFAFQRQFLLHAAPAVVKVFVEQLKRALEQCQVLSLAHRMDSLLAMASIEKAGIHIDAEEAARQTASLKSAASVLDAAMEAYVPSEVPVDMRIYFDWASLQQQHAYFFGGTISLGHQAHARDTPLWTSNVVHLCHRYGAFPHMVGELHLQRYAAQCALPTSGGLPNRVHQHIEAQGSQKLKTYRIVFFDIETTGLNPSTDAIVEVAMFDPIENSTFHTLVNPQRSITPRTVGIHHITNAMVRDAPTVDVVAKSIGQYLRLDKASYNPHEILVLVGHNVFSVDEPMLRRALECHAPECQLDGILFCDSLALLNAHRSELRWRMRTKRTNQPLMDALASSLRLSRLITALNVRPEGDLHRADTDTKALWYVLVNILGVADKDAVVQRDKILIEAANCFLRSPSIGCFVPAERQNRLVKVRLPGVAADYVRNVKLIASLQSKVFSETVLASLHAHGVKPAGLLLQRQLLDRHTSTFLQPSTGGRLAILHRDGRVHQHIDMTATTTSRTVSAYPSCQNIPKDDKSSVRRLFVSRFGSKGRCVEVDYSQLEIVVLAILCNDANLTKDLNSGVDFHVKRAAFFSGLPYDEIYQGYKRNVPKYVKLRKTAKQFSFQRLYGAGVPLLHKTTGIPVKDLEASIQRENEEYPGIAQFHRIIRSVALRPNNPGLPTSFIAEMPTGLRMSLRTRDVVLNLPPIKNYPIQGYGAELAQMMLGRLYRHFVRRDFYEDRAFLINFVHDSVWMDCHVDVLRECVTDTCRILGSVHEYVPKVFPGVKISVPLQVSASCGVDMCSMESIKDDDYTFVSKQRKTRPAEVHDFLDLTTAKSNFSAVMEESVASEEEESGETATSKAEATE